MAIARSSAVPLLWEELFQEDFIFLSKHTEAAAACFIVELSKN
jgi:hypothetical protein